MAWKAALAVVLIVLTCVYIALVHHVHHHPITEAPAHSLHEIFSSLVNSSLKSISTTASSSMPLKKITPTTTPWKRSVQAQMQVTPFTNCTWPRPRNFQTNPVVVLGNGYPSDGVTFHALKCDVPCLYSSDHQKFHFTADASLIQSNLPCPDQHSVQFSMENVILPPRDRTYTMLVSLKTDVPVPYYSWSDFDIMKPLNNKTGTALASAFVSNCVPERRAIIEELMKEGVTVDSFGSCLHNKEERSVTKEKGKYAAKIDIMSKYKFHLAFENSIADDYVTEKFFQALMAGTIPVVYGAPNIRMFEPSPDSILVLKEFPTVAALAKRMKELAADPAAYDRMLQWKRDGPSDAFKAAMDFTTVHSECRLCLRIADDYAAKHGDAHHGLAPGAAVSTEPVPAGARGVLVRERNAYYYRRVVVAKLTVAGLHDAIKAAFAGHTPLWARSRRFDGTIRVFSVYHSRVTAHAARSDARLLTDADVAAMKENDRFDAVFV